MCEDQREDICGSVSAHFWPQPAAVTHNYLVVQKCVCLPVHIAYTFTHMCPHIYIRKKTDSQCVLRSASAHHSCLFLFSLALQFSPPSIRPASFLPGFSKMRSSCSTPQRKVSALSSDSFRPLKSPRRRHSLKLLLQLLETGRLRETCRPMFMMCPRSYLWFVYPLSMEQLWPMAFSSSTH